MKHPAIQAISNVVTALCVGLILLTIVIVLVQIRDLSNQIKTQNEVIKQQTDINQKFLRCLVLLPPDKFRDPIQRVIVVDKCATESKLPDGSTHTAAPTQQDKENFDNSQKQNSQPAPRPTMAQPTVPATQVNPQPTATPVSTVSPQPAQPEPSLVESLTTPVLNLLDDVL